MATLIQIRRDTTTNWSAENPTLSVGEIGINITTWDFKIGDGSTAWNSLDYYIPTNALGDYYTSALLDAGQLDNRYYTETELDTALGLKSDTTHNHALAGLSEQDHSSLNDDEATKHRIINDSGTSATELYSASKVETESLKRGVYIGSSAPATTYAYMLWQDTNIATRFMLKRRNSGDSAWEVVYSVETANRTINWTTSDSATDIQADIDEIGKTIPYSIVITCQFADGTYTQNDNLEFTDFQGGGQINIYGNSSDSSASTTKSVYLNCNNSTSCFNMTNNDVRMNVRYFKISVQAGNTGISVNSNFRYTDIDFNYVYNSVSATGRGLYVQGCTNLRAVNNYWGLFDRGIYVYARSRVEVNTDYDNGPGDQPVYGVHSRYVSSVGIIGGSLSGSTADTYTQHAGQIWT